MAGTSFRTPLDFWIHFLGGVSIAYFLFHALRIFETAVGSLTPPGHYVFAFALACTVGIFWEFAELFSDTFLHTAIQQTIEETMSDLIADACGASTALLLIGSARFFRVAVLASSRAPARPGPAGKRGFRG